MIFICQKRRRTATSRVIRPQKGPQEKFLATSADIAIYGGAAGGGKTYALLMEPLRYIYTKGYRAVIFRKSYTQINASGGLWDESTSMYVGIHGAIPTKSPKYHWRFAKKAVLYFDYLGRDDDLNRWQGSQITFIGFDELTHFSERQFFYMLSRNRSTCGVKPYVRATCNPDADSWVARFIAWWIDQDTGYPIKERSGKVRYMARVQNEIIWGDTRQELIDSGTEPTDIKSVTFIASTLQDNKILMEKDPSYMANLKALPIVEKERLLYGNWKIKAAAGLFYQRTQVTMIETLPNDIYLWARGWDLAATSEDENGEPAYTAGVLIGKEYLEYCLQEIRRICAELKIELNEKKTRIVKLSHGFTFLKTQIYLTDTGKILRKPCRKAVVRQRRKLVRQYRKFLAGELSFEDIRCSYASWRGCMEKKQARRTIHSMNRLFDRLFIENWQREEVPLYG